MPAILDRCVEKVMGQGHSEDSAYAICRSSLGLQEDGSEDEKEIEEPEEEELERRIQEQILKKEFSVGPVLRKRMVVAKPIGKFINGDQKGVLGRQRLADLVERFAKYPRQVPIYLLVGQLEQEMREHPVDLDSRTPDGWVEGVDILPNDDFQIDAKLHGSAAEFVLNDLVRGASIGTVNASDHDGSPIGEVLHHVVLTNNPFIKNLNIAASRVKGGEKPLLYFTALSTKKEGPTMPEKEVKKVDPNAEDLSLKEKVEAHEMLLQEKEKTIRELTASNQNLMEELEKYRENPQLEQANLRMKQMERQLQAEKIRRLVKKGLDAGQFKKDQVAGYDADSDEVVLAWFKNSIFENDMGKLQFALQTFPKRQFNKTFHSGNGGDESNLELSADDKAEIKKMGKDPAHIARMKGVKTYDEYKRVKAETKEQ